MEAGGEDAGVDATGDAGMPGHLGHDGDAEDVGDVGGPQAPARLGDEDDAVVAAGWSLHKAS